MKLFGFNKKPKEIKFRITEPDREWIEQNFNWLIKVYGYPQQFKEQILLNEIFFPETFKTENIEVGNLICDLSALLDLDKTKITFELYEDLRDTYGMPYEIVGKQFESDTELVDNEYKIHIAKSLLKRPKQIIFHLLYEFIKIRLIDSKLKFDTGSDTSLFIYIAGIYFGFGVILFQSLKDIGRVDDGFWETKWNYISEMPNEVLAFGLATYSKLLEEDNPGWKNELTKELKFQFEQAIEFLNENPSHLNNEVEKEATNLTYQAYKEYQNQELDSAISTLQKSLLLTKDDGLKITAYNNIGYYQIRKGEFEQSISNFLKALEIDSNFGYANDNLGYALIRIGQLEEGKKYLEKAIRTKNNDRAYSHRNFAIYYFDKKEFDKAEENFKLAFDSVTIPVDLLEFHYAQFLLSVGNPEKGLKYLSLAVDKKEPEAIKLMNEINEK